MGCAGVCTFATVLLVTALVAAMLVPGARGLSCYQCGSLREGMSTVNPCFGIKTEDKKECRPEEQFCKRYSNEGVIVLACEENCVESHSQTTDITCCSTDGCNAGWVPTPSALMMTLPALVTVGGLLLLLPIPR